MDNKVAEVQVGLKRIDIRAVTAEVVEAKGSVPGVRFGDRIVTIENKVRAVGFEPGDRATLFWCSRGDRESDWAAGYNHRTARFGVSPHGLNELIAPPFYTAMAVAGIFVGLFSLFAVVKGSGPAVLLLILCTVPFVLVSSRHKKVRRAIEAALAEIKQREGKPAAAAA